MHAPARNRQEKNLVFFDCWSSILTVFAVFVGQKNWFLQCFCTLPKLEFFAQKCFFLKNLANNCVFGDHVVENVASCGVF